MGADSAGVSDYSITYRQDPKIYKVDNMLIGFTSSFRMGQLLGYKLILPKYIEEEYTSVNEYMCTSFIDTVRNCLKDGGYSSKLNDTESGGTFIVALMNKIFTVYSDYQVAEDIDKYSAVGCGADLALGSLYTTENIFNDDSLYPSDISFKRIELALEAASRFSTGVSKPFNIRYLES